MAHEMIAEDGYGAAGGAAEGPAAAGAEEETIDAAYVEALVADAASRHAEVAAAAAAGAEAPAADAGYAGADAEMGGGGAAYGGKEEEVRPEFAPLTAADVSGGTVEYRKVRVPPHRMTPLKEAWEELCKYLVEHMKLMVRMNVKTRTVELKTSEHTVDPGSIQKAEDFVQAFMMGFELADAVALLRLDDIYVEQFEVTDVKPLKGDHLSRAIGRIAGQGGKTKYAIENATRTRIVIADKKVFVMGAYSNIQVARDTICSLILGTPPGKVYNSMRSVASRIQQRY